MHGELEFQIEIDNTDEVLKASRDAINRALEVIGGKAESYAKENLTRSGAVDTGALRNSVTHVIEDDGTTVAVGSAMEYAPYIELGTGIYAEGGGGRQTPWVYKDAKGNWHRTQGNKPRPYLRPAFQDHMEEYKKLIERSLKG